MDFLWDERDLTCTVASVDEDRIIQCNHVYFLPIDVFLGLRI